MFCFVLFFLTLIVVIFQIRRAEWKSADLKEQQYCLWTKNLSFKSIYPRGINEPFSFY